MCAAAQRDPAELPEEGPSRFVVGIDLGTTNSAATFVDTAARPWRVEVLAIPQLVAPGQVEARESLPSFHYQPAAGELAPHRTMPSASSPGTTAARCPGG